MVKDEECFSKQNKNKTTLLPPPNLKARKNKMLVSLCQDAAKH